MNTIEVYYDNFGNKSYFGVDFGDCRYELFVGDASVSVSVGIFNDLVDFGCCEMLSDWGCHSLEVNSIEHAFSSGIECFKDWLKSSLWGDILIESEDVQKSSKIDVSLMSSRLDNSENLWGLLLEIKSLDGVN